MIHYCAKYTLNGKKIMNNIIKIITVSSIIVLTGCTGQQASMGERFQDSFLFTSAKSVESNQERCITLTKQISMPSGSVTFTLPAGRYVARKQNKDGYFYYAPSTVTTSNWLLADSQQGIFLSNDGSSGNLFGYDHMGYDNRPIRSVVLPGSIYSFIKKSKC